MNYGYVGHMWNTNFCGILVFPLESWLQWEPPESSLIYNISQTPESTFYRWPVPMKHESISRRIGLDRSVSPIACHGRCTSNRYFIEYGKSWYREVTNSFCLLQHTFTSAGDDTSSCDWGTDESKFVSALQGAICGWRNPGWDWCVPAPVLLCEVLISTELPKDSFLFWGGALDSKYLNLGSGKILSGCYKIASQNSFFPRIFTVHLKKIINNVQNSKAVSLGEMKKIRQKTFHSFSLWTLILSWQNLLPHQTSWPLFEYISNQCLYWEFRMRYAR